MAIRDKIRRLRHIGADDCDTHTTIHWVDQRVKKVGTLRDAGTMLAESFLSEVEEVGC